MAGLDPWVDGTRSAPAPGAWIWVPAAPQANHLVKGPSPDWPEALSQAMAHWLATQEPGLKPPGNAHLLTSAPQPTAASQRVPSRLSAGDWGGIGLIQTPTARLLSAGHAGFTLSRSQPYTHFNLSVQPFDGVEGVMRYTRVQGRLYGAEIAGDRAYLDKSLEIKLRVADESVTLPALALGWRDPLGTGLFGGEYLVASKHLGAGAWGQWDASLGLGWGYSGAAQNLANPLARLSARFATRQESEVGQGGLARVRSWFTGRTALFGGLQWQAPILPLVFKAEWDGNDYQHEPSTAYRFASRSRLNLGLVWHTGPAAWSLSWQRGQVLALNFSVQTDISGLRYNTSAGHRAGAAPTASRWLSAWAADEFAAGSSGSLTAPAAASPAAAAQPNLPSSAEQDAAASAPPPLQALLAAVGQATGWLAQDLRAQGGTWVLQAERAGGLQLRERLLAVAELLHAAAPAHVLIFEVQATVLGVEVSRHRIDRRLWALSQNQWLPPSAQREAITAISAPLTPRVSGDAARPRPQADATSLPLPADAPSLRLPAEAAGLRVQSDAPSPAPNTTALVPQRWLWQVSPGWQQTVGGPDGLLYALSARASSHLPLWRGAWLNGQTALRVADNYGHYKYTAPSGLPRVRTYIREYQTSAALTVPNLQVNQLIALGSQTHALVYAGLLEPMFAGVGAEILHRPLGANWAVGADWNVVRQRDFRQNLSLRDYRVNTGHVSAQWATGWAGVEVFAQAGRYLAGDVGGTLNVSRAFANGSRMGVWATKTRVSAQQFGEGSFDKGVYVSVPFELLLGRPAGGSASVVWQPLIRDGGARLNRAQTLWGLTTLREPMALHYSNPPAPAPWQDSMPP
jgi:Exopolysaccharide biosynthesis protein YbjH